MLRAFAEVDVFTAEPYRGNPLAVVLDGTGLSTEQMQQFANWTNFSETTFLLPPTDPAADYLVRIFTTTMELPFAGHPTLGSCHAWLANGGTPQHSDRVVQQCGVGLVSIARGEHGLAFAAPPLLRDGPLDDATLAAATDALGIDPAAVVDSAWIDNGPGWLGIVLASADDVLAIKVRSSDLKIGVVGAYPPDSPFAYEVRAFFPADGITFEDPVTGSLNASAAQWLIGSGRLTAPYIVSQGTAMGRAGRVRITTDADGQVWVGGEVVTCVSGTVDL
ncbi:MAG: PhzF family phenazine biosynthesis protein [Actinomycetota bacterium]|nr:PhzF family phenazine biosynthesis protein [Actinomycetota bacterium]